MSNKLPITRFLVIVLMFLMSVTSLRSQNVFDSLITDNQIIDLCELSNHQYVGIATIKDPPTPYNNFIGLIKLDSTGNMLWAKKLQITQMEYALKIRELADGSFIILGIIENSLGSGAVESDIFLIKTDSSGNVNWAKRYWAGQFEDHPSDIAITADNNIIVVGNTTGYYNTPIIGTCGLIMKVDTSGSVIWEKGYYKSASDDYFNSVCILSDHSIAISGNSIPGFQLPYNPVVIVTDSSGNKRWSKTITGPSGTNESNTITEITGSGLLALACSYYNPTCILFNTASGAIVNSTTYYTQPHNSITIKYQQSTGHLIFSGNHYYNFSFTDSKPFCLIIDTSDLHCLYGRDYNVGCRYPLNSQTILSSSGDVLLLNKKYYGSVLMGQILRDSITGIAPCNSTNIIISNQPLSLTTDTGYLEVPNPFMYSRNETCTSIGWSLTTAPDCLLMYTQENYDPVKIIISPNPAHNLLNVKINEISDDVQIIVYDINGTIKSNFSAKPENNIDIAAYSSGLYMLSVRSKYNTYTRLFSKE